jgi:hypothetical protein
MGFPPMFEEDAHTPSLPEQRLSLLDQELGDDEQIWNLRLEPLTIPIQGEDTARPGLWVLFATSCAVSWPCWPQPWLQ